MIAQPLKPLNGGFRVYPQEAIKRGEGSSGADEDPDKIVKMQAATDVK